jgi:Tfp pilus assembly PilM family ATPase
VPGRDALVRRLTLQAIGATSVEDALSKEAERALPVAVGRANVSLDYHVFSRTATGPSDVLLVAARKHRIDDRAAVIRQAGHHLLVLDVEGVALANAYNLNYPEQSDGLTVLVHTSHSATLCLLERGQLAFAGDFPIDDPTALVVAMRQTVETWLATSAEEVSRLMLSGDAWRTDALSELLGAAFSIPVSLFDPFRKVRRPGQIDGRAALGPAYAVAIGLALHGERDR